MNADHLEAWGWIEACLTARNQASARRRLNDDQRKEFAAAVIRGAQPEAVAGQVRQALKTIPGKVGRPVEPPTRATGIRLPLDVFEAIAKLGRGSISRGVMVLWLKYQRSK